jgi:hypothetical protein
METNGFRCQSNTTMFHFYFYLDNMFRPIDHHQVNWLQHNMHTRKRRGSRYNEELMVTNLVQRITDYTDVRHLFTKKKKPQRTEN